MVWLWDILLPNMEWSHHHSMSFFADSRIYKRLCPSVGSSVSQSVCWFVSKSWKVEKQLLKRCMRGGNLAFPLPIHPRRYCNTSYIDQLFPKMKINCIGLSHLSGYAPKRYEKTIFATVSFVIRNMQDTKKTKKQINLS